MLRVRGREAVQAIAIWDGAKKCNENSASRAEPSQDRSTSNPAATHADVPPATLRRSVNPFLRSRLQAVLER